MRKPINYLCVLLLIVATHGFIQAQDFTVEIESTDASNNYFKPLKPGGSRQFQIKVKNNTSDTCTVSIDKYDMGYVSSWVSIEDNEQELFPSQSKNFLLTITVPSGTTEGLYAMYLYFSAYAKGSSHNNSFQYDTQWIIVDNSPPDAPTFSIGQKTSTTLSITSWSSWDQFSSEYTFQTGSADNGIKEYKIFIETTDGNVVKSEIKKPDDALYHKFQNLNPNTEYYACVTATDLVGYSTTTKQLETMPPAAPTGLAFSDITYIDATLSWSPSDGATGYNIYIVVGETHTKINSSTIASNSYTIVNLEPNTTYKYYVRALSDVGLSDPSNSISVTTVALPVINGLYTVCNSNTTFTISSLLSGFTVDWDCSINMNMISENNSSCVVSAINSTINGSGTVTAKITNINNDSVIIVKDVWVNTKPPTISPPMDAITHEYQSVVYTGKEYNFWGLVHGEYIHDVSNNYLWTIISPEPMTFPYMYNDEMIIYTSNYPGIHTFKLRYNGECGWSPDAVKYVNFIENGYYSMIISPNPASDNLTVEIIDESNSEESKENDMKITDVKLYNNMQIPVYTNKKYQKRFDVNVSNLPTGVYHLQVIYKGEKISKQVLIQH